MNNRQTRSIGKLRPLWLALGPATAVILLTLLLWGIGQGGISAAPLADLYVDGATGTDTGACGTAGSPCQTISYTLNSRAASGDSIFVAQGTYVENLIVSRPVNLYGGYESAGWTRDLSLYETVLDGSGSAPIPGDWDERVRYPMVINDGGTYKMWYVGIDVYDTGRIGYATSPNGIDWTKHGANPVLDVAAAGEWDEAGFEAPFVIKEGASSYKMWYSGLDAAGNWRIGYATSSDGIQWTKYAGNPVLDLGSDDWNNHDVLHPAVINEGGTYKMWFIAIGDDGSGLKPVMAYATSPDGTNWALDPASPLFGRTWEGWLWGPTVRATGSGYEMWHSVWAGELLTSYATATTETAWTKHGSAVLNGTPGEWDEGNAANPSVFYEGSTYTMWYDNGREIGMATSPDGIAWTKSISNPVFLPGEATQWGQPVVRFEPGSDGAVLDGFTVTGGQVGQAGGGINIEGASPIIQSCLIEGNTAQGTDEWGGGGILVGGGADPEIRETIITGNNVSGGASAIRVGDAHFTLVNSLLVSNSGRPAIHGNDASMTLTNVTIADNGPDGGLWLNNTTATILNSIIWEDQGQDVGVDGSGAYTITYSNVEDGVLTGAGNISADPLFVDIDNYHPTLRSPVIDAGIDTGAPGQDLDGAARPLDGDGDGVATTDMGAYEFVLFRIFLPVITR